MATSFSSFVTTAEPQLNGNQAIAARSKFLFMSGASLGPLLRTAHSTDFRLIRQYVFANTYGFTKTAARLCIDSAVRQVYNQGIRIQA
jgi:hypothetical protein